MPKSVNLGIIGGGEIVNHHLNVLKEISFFKLYSITSKTNKNSNKLKKLYSIKNIHINYLEMSKDNKIDCFLICVSPNSVFDVLKTIIPTKKPFFTEKPFALNILQSKKIFNLLKKYKNKNIVGYNRRFYSIFQKGLEYLKKNGGLKAINIEGHERFWLIKKKIKNKKILKNWIYVNNTHMIDLITYFIGDIKKMKYISKNSKNFILSFVSNRNVIGTYTSYWNSPGGWTVKLYGNEHTIIFDPLEKGYILNKKFEKKELIPSNLDIRFKQGFYKQMIAYKSLINTQKLSWPACDINNAMISMKIANNLTKNCV